VHEDKQHLIFRPNKAYTLFYWDKGWKLIARKTVPLQSKAISFSKVPKNALFILVPEYSKLKDRPFLISKQGQMIWF
jgi:hypothetical protein